MAVVVLRGCKALEELLRLERRAAAQAGVGFSLCPFVRELGVCAPCGGCLGSARRAGLRAMCVWKAAPVGLVLTFGLSLCGCIHTLWATNCRSDLYEVTGSCMSSEAED